VIVAMIVGATSDEVANIAVSMLEKSHLVHAPAI
jgi:hypothetical protein